MKRLIVLIILVSSISCFGQAAPANNKDSTGNQSKKVSFVTKVDIKNATKDGVYMEGYVVNIPYEKAMELDGKTVRISGKVTIVKAISQDSNAEKAQGRQVDTKHILHPKIELVN